MDRKTKSLIPTQTQSLLRFCLASLCAIVVISTHVASVEAADNAATVEIPQEMAHKMRPAVSEDGAFDTPFFNAAQEEITLKSLKGRGVILNFWATWCAPCVREMPALDRLTKILEGSGVEVITISADRKPLQKVPPFLKANELNNLDLYYDSKSQLARKIGVKGLPTTVLLAADGTIAGRVMGVLEWDAPENVAYLTAILAPQSK